MKTPALLCLRFQALAEALKINSSVMNINWEDNDIGAEGAKAWCAVVSVECRHMYSCHVLDIL